MESEPTAASDSVPPVRSKPKMESFPRWFFTHMPPNGEWLPKAVFMNIVTMGLLVLYGYQIVRAVEVTEGFNLLIGMVLGYYFKGQMSVTK